MANSYFESGNYYKDRHWHISFYKDYREVEAVALKRIHDGTWDVFFNDFLNDLESDVLIKKFNSHKIKDFGIFLFNSIEDEVESKFEKWVIKELLPERE